MDEIVYTYSEERVNHHAGVFMRKVVVYRWRFRLFLSLILLTIVLVGASVSGHVRRLLAIRMDLPRTESFRSMKLSDGLLQSSAMLEEKTGWPIGRVLLLEFAENHAVFPQTMPETEKLKEMDEWLVRWRPREYQALEDAFGAVWDDVSCFPVKCEAGYENSWMARRTYGGERGHEGTDLMPPSDQSGVYPVFSVTEGVVEKMGWLPKGGYRVGVRSPSGGYFYYAHLSEYAQGLSQGQSVEAGQLLGYMGDTGYGPEGTTGKFKVHLHFGIYINTQEGEELSVNPYWVLRYLEMNKT